MYFNFYLKINIIKSDQTTSLFQSVLLNEVVIEPNVKLECVPKFCYLGNMLGVREKVEEAARARVRCAWSKFKEFNISYPDGPGCIIPWAMKKANLPSLERTYDGEMDVRSVAEG